MVVLCRGGSCLFGFVVVVSPVAVAGAVMVLCELCVFVVVVIFVVAA